MNNKYVSPEKIWKVMLEDENPEISIGSIDIYTINNRFGLFRNYVPVIEEVEDAWGTHKGIQSSLQNAVDVALLHEFGSKGWN